MTTIAQAAPEQSRMGRLFTLLAAKVQLDDCTDVPVRPQIGTPAKPRDPWLDTVQFNFRF